MRLSVGIEDVDDLMADLDGAFRGDPIDAHKPFCAIPPAMRRSALQAQAALIRRSISEYFRPPYFGGLCKHLVAGDFRVWICLDENTGVPSEARRKSMRA